MSEDHHLLIPTQLFSVLESVIHYVFVGALEVRPIGGLSIRKALPGELTAVITVPGRQIASMTVLCSAQAVWLLLGVNYL